MSDDDTLGDFFAKKDKSKKPKKKKKTKTETVITQSDSQLPQVDEWKDFEEQKEKDFSNLKIADLQGGEDGEKEEQEAQQYDENDPEGEEGSDAQAVWKASQSNGTSAPPPPPVQQAPKEIPGSHNVVGSKYVPPSQKRSTMSSASHPSVPRGRRGAPPDIKSQAAFPTLAAAGQDTDSVPTDFEMVKRGMRTNDARRDDTSSTLETGNRYQGLRS